MNKNIFRTYDIRGLFPDDIDENAAYKIAVAYALKTKAKNVALGKDLRSASDSIYNGLEKGLVDCGANVKKLGTITNPMLGFAVWNYNLDGGIIASASHDKVGYAGIKMMSRDAISIPGDDPDIKNSVLQDDLAISSAKGSSEDLNIKEDYLKFLFSQIDIKAIKPLKVFIDPFFGSIGLIIKDIAQKLPIEPIYFQVEPTTDFGNVDEPDPLTPNIRKKSLEEFKKSGADFGVMWDGDGDRCFFIDENGEFINAPYITALISKHILEKNPGAKIVGDMRIVWPIEKAVSENGGEFIQSEAGYRFIKEKMAENDAEFGAEMSGHYFFKTNHNCDNGIIPLLIISEILSKSDKKLSQLVAPYKQGHLMIDEIEITGKDFKEILEKLKSQFKDFDTDETDGLTVKNDDFRFNIRPSHTEPDIKLNIEAKSQEKLDEIKEKVLSII